MATHTQDRVIPTEQVLGIPIAVVDLAQAIEIIERFIQGDSPQLVVTANAIAAVMAHDDPAFADEVRSAGLVTCDGAGTQWALKRGGHENAAKVTGIDLLEQLCRLSSDKGYRLYFLGGAPGVAEEARNKLQLRVPGCNIVGCRDGFFPVDDDDLVAQEIAEFKPDVVFIAMGMPRQERFFLKTKHLLGAKVGIGVGGALDVFSGRTKRAPEIWQRLKLEWLWRALLNPKKLKNLKNLPRFMWLVKTGK
ncbi:MAG: WecB/TagA/CpsF family glycosyltransferase [Chthonomonas sp.]|nr:WecB/TagA/CpsF family glycosyltransferase [Chthonomonas sp.]